MAETHDALTYNRVAKAFHWTIALLIAVMFVLGWTMDSESRTESHLTAVDFHMTLGLVIMVLVMLRLIWRLGNPPPPLPDHMSRMERRAAGLAHATLYALTFAIPAAGLIMVLYEGSADLFFGLIDLRGKPLGSEEVAELFSEIHMWLGWALVLVLVGHISAALGHHFFLKDGLLYRMLPALSRTRRA